jgi:hypothetical protein
MKEVGEGRKNLPTEKPHSLHGKKDNGDEIGGT